MRSRSSLVFFLAAPCLVAQDPWSAVDLAVRQQCRPDQFGLVLVQPAGSTWSPPPRLLLELQVVQPPKEVPGGLPAPLKTQGWALYAPGGQRLAEGPGEPQIDQIQALMEKAGWRPLMEQLRSYLREHPEDGEAWASLVEDMSREAFFARGPGTQGPKLTEAQKSDLAWALGGFHRAWSGSPGMIMNAFGFMRALNPREDPVLSRVWTAWTDSAAEQFARDPARFDLLDWALDRTGDALLQDPLYQLAMDMEPLPGVPWPPTSYLPLVKRRHADNPAALAKELGRILDSLLAPEWVTRLGRNHVLFTLTSWGPEWVEAFIRKGDLEGAQEAIARLRTLSGQGWKRVSALLNNMRALGAGPGAEAEWARISPLNLKDRALLQKALAEPALPDPVVERIPPLRAAVLGPADPLAWAKLQIDRQLKAWSPEELVWTPLGKEEASALAATLGDGPRWVVLRGDRMLATGVRLTPDDLAAALRSQAAPRLEVLDAFIRTHPDRLDARRARLDLLRPRLPDADLEGRFLEDALATRRGLAGLGFEPKGEAWRRAAATQCSQLGEDLSRWSSNLLLWPAYIQWSALDPGSPRAADLLRDMSTWPYRFGTRLPGPIWEPAISTAVRALGEGKRHGELDAFMEVVWDRGLRDFLEARMKGPEGPASGARALFNMRLDFIRPWMEAWGRALRALPDPRRLKEIQSRLELIQPGLASLLSQPAGKP